MKEMIKLATVVAVLCLLGAFLSGCEDTDVTLPSGGVINMNPQPGAIQFDSGSAETDEKTSTITAMVFDERNLAQKGVTIDFESTSGVPMAPPTAVTDANGRAQTVLTVTRADRGTVSVSARSGVVTGVLSLEVSVGELSQPPQAALVITPGQSGQVGEVITFDGSGSLEGDSGITCYKWTMLSNNPDPDMPQDDRWVIQGIGASGFNEVFENEQGISVLFRVTDRVIDETFRCANVNGSEQLAGVEPDSAFDDLSTVDYQVVCRNLPPTADILGSGFSTPANPSQLTSVILDGSGSTDDDGMIDRYQWNCGSEFSPVPVVSTDPSRVICRYPPGVGTYTATLKVFDNGTGAIDPRTGTFFCLRESEDSVSISLTAPAPQ